MEAENDDGAAAAKPVDEETMAKIEEEEENAEQNPPRTPEPGCTAHVVDAYRVSPGATGDNLQMSLSSSLTGGSSLGRPLQLAGRAALTRAALGPLLLLHE